MQRQSPRRRARRCTRLQPQVREDPLYHWCLQDGGDDLELAAAIRAVFEVDLEHPLEQPSLADARRPAVRAAWLGRGELRFAGGLLGAMRHHQCPQLGIGRQHPMGAMLRLPSSHGRTSANRSRPFWSLLLFVSIVLVGAFGGALWPHRTLEPPSVLGEPLRYSDAGADRVYLLTRQWETRRSAIYGRSSTSYRQQSRLHLDLCVFDPATAQPLRRHRLHSEKSSVQAAPLGIDKGILWARGPELLGIRLSDGAVVADNTRVAARNPALRGLLPLPPPTTFLTEPMQPLKFENSLVLTLSDARRVRIDPVSLEATPLEAAAPGSAAFALASRSALAAAASSGAEASATTRAKAASMGVLSLRDLLVKSIVVGNDWLGLMDQSDLNALRERRALAVSPPRGPPQPQRLYRAGTRQEKGFLGLDRLLVDPVPLPKAPEFLTAGLLVGETQCQAPARHTAHSVN